MIVFVTRVLLPDLFVLLLFYLFVQQLFLEHLLCSRQGMTVSKLGIVPIVELTVCLESHTDDGEITVAVRACRGSYVVL